MVMKCLSCGAENPDHATYCNLCLSCVGFEDLEFTQGARARDEGFRNKYPSSFGEGAPVLPPGAFSDQPDAPPVDIGKYGVRSGEQVKEAPPGAQAPAASPIEIGEYGTHSGHEPHETAPLPRDYRDGNTDRRRRKNRR